MKLLNKKAISSDFNTQRKMQIDEGVLIAKKVEVLRETLVLLETQQKAFIANSRQELLNATSLLHDKKARVEGEIRQLEEKRKELLKPLDDRWALLEEHENALGKEKEDTAFRTKELHERENQLVKTEKAIEKTRGKISELEKFIENNVTKTQQDRTDAKIIKDTAIKERELQDKEQRTRNNQLNKQEEELMHQRKYLELIKRNIEAHATELDDKERAINDKYATLQRTITRLKK